MIDVEPLIASELERMLPLPVGNRSDWVDVLHRAGLARADRPRFSRRTAALAGAVVVGLAAAVPAFGLPQTVVNWFSASPAPSSAQESFRSLDIGAPAGMAPGVSGPARSVMESQIDGQEVHLWVAPTTAGGYCLDLEGYGGGCDRNRQLPLAPTIAEHTLQTPVVVAGAVLSPEVGHIELSFPSGQSFSIPVVYVSAPISAGFFVYQLPYTTAGPHPEGPGTFEAVRSDGSVIATETMQGFFFVPRLAPNN